MKFPQKGMAAGESVAPCAGAWIEIFAMLRAICSNCVAPCAGAWIEIQW